MKDYKEMQNKEAQKENSKRFWRGFGIACLAILLSVFTVLVIYL